MTFLAALLAISILSHAQVSSESFEAENIDREAQFTDREAQLTGSEAQLIDVRGGVQYKARDRETLSRAIAPLSLATGDLIRTLDNGTAVVWLTNASCSVKLKPLSTLQILPAAPDSSPLLSLRRGALYFFSRSRSRELRIRTEHATGAPRGTEFLITVDSDQTTLVVFDGDAALTNQYGHVELATGEAAQARRGHQPVKVKLEALNIVQWWLYYPGVLSVDELEFAPAEREALSSSLEAYRLGALADALSAFPGYPSPSEPVTESGRIYLAALFLAAGEVGQAEALLAKVGLSSPAAASLHWVIAAVQGKIREVPELRPSASECLGLSYYYQAHHELHQALAAANRSVAAAANFAFGWERVAELEFSFGYIGKARVALDKSLRLAPRNAQARALMGFLHAAEGHLKPARQDFEEAIRLDPNLGNAWLGRGLVKIRVGDLTGRMDLQTAAILEPNRSLFRSYLGKGFADANETAKAAAELARAAGLDPEDPTPWLYSALLKRDQNRINDAVRDLQTSVKLNTNRAVYRSAFLLDEDLAVRSASLASLYRDAGMTEVSLREAARAVTYDYANDSAHLFLSDAYNDLRDPTRFNLRYETVWFNELLLANVLAPVGAGRLSQHVSQQEYSKLLETDGLGFASSTIARTDGQVEELASQYGTFGGTSYALDLDYQHNDGVRVNNDLSRTECAATMKQQVTTQDTALLLIQYEDYHSGDNYQYYNPAKADPNFRFDEYQHPTVVGAWHHEWSPSAHTLLLAGRLINEQHFSDQKVPINALIPANPYLVIPYTFDLSYSSSLEIYTAELNQIFQWNRVTLSAGGRYQTGSFHTDAQLFNPSGNPASFLDARDTNNLSSDDALERITGYGYVTLEPLEQLWLTGGLAYDDLTYPRNFRHPPISSGEDHRSQLGPKAAVVWSPLPQAALRGMFARSLGGVSLDESYRLEPTQLAGFPQAFRSLISESVVGSVAAPAYETFGLALDLKFPSRTYAGLRAERLEENVRQAIGVFAPVDVSGSGFVPPFIPSSTDEQLDYHENAITASLDQLVGKDFVLGVTYKFTEAELHDLLPGVPATALATADQRQSSSLHHLTLYGLFNHSSGFFAQADADWYAQENSGYAVALPGDSFFQENLYVGYRFAHRRAELRLGLLNLAGQDYRLNPLTIYAELPRKRVLEASFKFVF